MYRHPSGLATGCVSGAAVLAALAGIVLLLAGRAIPGAIFLIVGAGTLMVIADGTDADQDAEL